LRIEVIAQAFKQGGLSRADFTRKNNEAFTGLNSVDQIGECFLVLRCGTGRKDLG
jgi:hypothetical protein